MRNTHEPNEEFIARLEAVVVAEARRRASSAPRASWAAWLMQSPLRTAAVAALLVVGSMAIGGGIVAAAYESQASEQRDALLGAYTQKAVLANQSLALAREGLSNTQQRVSVGIEGQEALIRAQLKVKEAETQVRLIDLQLQEIRTTGREPVRTVSAPLASGHDFVSDGWRIEMTLPQDAITAARYDLDSAQKRFSVGVGNESDVQAARTRILELEAAVAGVQKKLEIRQRFLNHDVDAALADLLMLENDARQRQQALAPRIDLARVTLDGLQKKVAIGAIPQADVAQAEIALMELELEMKKMNLDLATIQLQIKQYKAK